jgi:hypothetical protein
MTESTPCSQRVDPSKTLPLDDQSTSAELMSALNEAVGHIVEHDEEARSRAIIEANHQLINHISLIFYFCQFRSRRASRRNRHRLKQLVRRSFRHPEMRVACILHDLESL